MEINKIITLGNDEKYYVLDKVTKECVDYFYIAEVNDEENNIKDNYKIVTTRTEDNKTYIDEITGEQKLKEILPLFIEKIDK